jgi:hypothetical protein
MLFFCKTHISQRLSDGCLFLGGPRASAIDKKRYQAHDYRYLTPATVEGEGRAMLLELIARGLIAVGSMILAITHLVKYLR